MGWWATREDRVMTAFATPASVIDDAQAMRCANADLLSLALIDSRNRLLQALAAFEQHRSLAAGATSSPLWLVGHAGWYQEYWIARHVQRLRGEQSDPRGPRLASIHPRADEWFTGPDRRCEGLDTETLRAYLAETLETTLDLLGGIGDDDMALYFWRAALMHEDRLAEALAALMVERELPQALPTPTARADREPLWVPGARWLLGSTSGGWVPENERWGHSLEIPEFEIDALPVSWARYVAFAEDGGYDRGEWWSEEGFAWAQAEGRRAPRYVEQLRSSVLAMRQGQLMRVPAAQPAVHVTRHEAEAWCRWAGRRLPTEPEWEFAAATSTSRGFVWGDVFEWVAGSARAWPGHGATPDALDRLPPPKTQGVLRGGSWLTRSRLKHPKARRFAPLHADSMFCGFRSCAI